MTFYATYYVRYTVYECHFRDKSTFSFFTVIKKSLALCSLIHLVMCVILFNDHSTSHTKINTKHLPGFLFSLLSVQCSIKYDKCAKHNVLNGIILFIFIATTVLFMDVLHSELVSHTEGQRKIEHIKAKL